MEYTKPEIIPVGSALELIESSLDKNISQVDSLTGGDMTAAAAYEADE